MLWDRSIIVPIDRCKNSRLRRTIGLSKKPQLVNDERDFTLSAS